MKGQIKNSLKLSAVLLVAATLGWAQASVSTPGPYGPPPNNAQNGEAPAPGQGVPGTINYVEGQAMLNGQPLGPSARGHAVAKPNQTIQTQAGFVEVLLTPGAFLRIGHNSEVAPQSLGLANVQLQVVHGSAMIEATDLVKGTIMQVNMNGVITQVEKRGLYEFDANQQLVKVFDGKAKVLEASHVKTIGKGDQVVLTDPKLKSHGFDKQVAESDPLYVWSNVRSEAEAQANEVVANNVAIYGGWYGPGWYWDPFWSGYAFLPGGGFLYSPFGWGFYSPGFFYGAPFYRGFHGHRYYGRVGGISAGIHARGFHGRSNFHSRSSHGTSGFHGASGFHGSGGFHGGGDFHGGGFHGGGGHR
jgi:uncharacterized membrane protein YgcG